MRALLQRVSSASVTIDGDQVGAIDQGLVIFLGVTHGDSEADADYLDGRCVNLRIFEDADGKFNLSLLDVGGAALVISQFTLYGDTRKGRRPSFTAAAPPDLAEPLYEHFVAAIEAHGVKTQAGRFGANMQVAINNDGPVTVTVESKA